jgi:DNA-binding winged helix-turn-helix (wHTH) protein/tetratricopeptide (TPR) repeat protein
MKIFGIFRLDAANHCLWRGEERVSLAPKAFDVLRYLVEHADRLVTQEEILEVLWPKTYVNPEVVKKYILGIRKVLGDQSNKPAFVATFPRRGYRFIAQVREEATPRSSQSRSVAKAIVGREGALAGLEQALAKALKGQRQIVFITGEAGIGKTTLVDLFHQNTAFGADVLVARGQCVEGFGGKEAYYPLLEALGQLLRDAGDGSMIQSFARRAPTWLVQFPSMVKAEQREALEKEMMGATRERMVREICEALESITVQDPLVLILEDLHWVDPSTLDFISALARRRGIARLLLLGTYRPAEVIIAQSPLKALKQDLVIHDLSHEIILERLEEGDVAEYLALKFEEGGFPAEFAKLIFRHSGGNALFMVTILQDMVKKGLIAEAGGRLTLQAAIEPDHLSVPETLDQLIEAQFQQLSVREQRILRCASVAGEHFSVWSIATAADMAPDTIEDTCEKLAERLQFIKTAGVQELANGEISAHYDFRHSLYREVLFRHLSEGVRSKLHLLLAKRLESTCDPCAPELAAELALHFEGGYEFERAIRYLILAANNAAGRLAYRDSIEILQHALELAARLAPALRAELEVQIVELIGNAYFVLGALAESAGAYLDAASRAEKADLKAARVRALIGAMYPLGFIDPGQGLAAMERAVQMSMVVDDPVIVARTQMGTAGSRLVFDRWCREDADLCASAHETLRRLGDPGADPFQQVVRAHVLALQGDYRETLEICEAGGILGMNHGISQIAHFGALSGKTLALLRLGRLGEVLRITQAGRESVEENLARSWALDFREAWLRIMAFDFVGARRICDAICENKPDYLAGQPETISRIAAGHIALEHRDFAQAIEHFSSVCAPAVTVKFFLHWVWRMMAQLEVSNAWLQSGQIQRARAAADEFFASATSTSDPHLHALAWELKTRVAMAESDLSAARECIEQSLAIVDKFEILVAAWQAHATAWQLYRHTGEREAAELHQRRAASCVLKIANSFAPEEPLRATFLERMEGLQVISRTLSDRLQQPL